MIDGVIIRAMAVARRRRYQLLIVVAIGSVPLTTAPAPTMKMIRCESPGKCVQWSMMNAATMVVSPYSVTRRGPQRSIARPTNGMRSIGRALANIHSQGGRSATVWMMGMPVRMVAATGGRTLKLALRQTARMKAPTNMTCQPWKRRRGSGVGWMLMVSEALIAGLIDVWMSSCWRYGVIDLTNVMGEVDGMGLSRRGMRRGRISLILRKSRMRLIIAQRTDPLAARSGVTQVRTTWVT